MNERLQQQIHWKTEIFPYYQQRPELVDYTLRTELTRLEYTTTCSSTKDDEHPQLDELAQLLQDYDQNYQSLLPRMINQSIWADFFQCMMMKHHEQYEPPLLLIPSFVTAQATKCQFHILDPYQAQGRAHIELRTTNHRMIAQVQVQVYLNVLDPDACFYQIESIQPTALLNDGTFVWDDENPIPMEDPNSMAGTPTTTTTTNSLNFRDLFWQSSSAFPDGMLPQLFLLRNNTTNNNGNLFLSKELIEQANSEQYNNNDHDDDNDNHRPQSILGGWMRSLAQRVTLPDESTVYQEYYDNIHNNQPSQPSLSLYRKTETNPDNSYAVSPHLPMPPPLAVTSERNSPSTTTNYYLEENNNNNNNNTEEEIQDGWGEDDVDDDLLDENDLDGEEPNHVDDDNLVLEEQTPASRSVSPTNGESLIKFSTKTTTTTTTTTTDISTTAMESRDGSSCGAEKTGESHRNETNAPVKNIESACNDTMSTPRRQRWVNPHPGSRVFSSLAEMKTIMM